MAGLLSLFQKKREDPQCSAVIVAAGSARRMEGIDKALAPLGELPVLVHTLYSVQDGLKEVDPEMSLIAIHDGARPLVSQEIIRDTVARAALTGAAAPAVPLTDTVKRASEGRTEETVDRSALWAVQTPQVFEAGLIKGAVQKALDDGELLTDDCGAVERMGMPVTLTAGSPENLKITTPLDLILGEAILQARGEGVL